MGQENLRNNYTFYDGYEGEPEIVLMMPEAEEYIIHLWDGYFGDIFGDPVIDGNGWRGFTRDMNQLEGIFSVESIRVNIKLPEYLEDMLSYRNKTFLYKETSDALELMIDFLQYAIAHNYTVTAELI